MDTVSVLRRYMRLCESMTVLYHGSKRRFRVGTVLRAQRYGYAHASGFPAFEKRVITMCEDFLEKFRPADAIPRRSALFMVDDPAIIDEVGGYEDYVYQVEPIGPVTRCNLYWYSNLDGYCMNLDGRPDRADMYDVAIIAKAYWAAAPNDLDEPHRDQIEYLAQSAKIIAVKSA
jgi:hypothetical protein